MDCNSNVSNVQEAKRRKEEEEERKMRKRKEEEKKVRFVVSGF